MRAAPAGYRPSGLPVRGRAAFSRCPEGWIARRSRPCGVALRVGARRNRSRRQFSLLCLPGQTRFFPGLVFQRQVVLARLVRDVWKSLEKGFATVKMALEEAGRRGERFFERLCHRMWLFHLHSTVKRRPFSPFSPWRNPCLGYFIGYSFGISRNKASTVFYDTAF